MALFGMSAALVLGIVLILVSLALALWDPTLRAVRTHPEQPDTLGAPIGHQ